MPGLGDSFKASLSSLVLLLLVDFKNFSFFYSKSENTVRKEILLLSAEFQLPLNHGGLWICLFSVTNIPNWVWFHTLRVTFGVRLTPFL